MRYMDVTCARNFLRLSVKAERVFPIPPTIINNPPIIRTDHLSIRKWFWLESTVAIVDEVVRIDMEDEDIFDDDEVVFVDDDKDVIW